MSISVEINCGCGEIGKLASLRNWWLTPCRFKSDQPHQQKNSDMDIHMSVFFAILSCVACCVNRLFNNKGREKMAVLLTNTLCVLLRKLCCFLPPFEFANNYLIPTLFLEKTIITSISRGAEDQATYATCLGNHAVLQMSYIGCSKNDITTTTS